MATMQYYFPGAHLLMVAKIKLDFAMTELIKGENPFLTH